MGTLTRRQQLKLEESITELRDKLGHTLPQRNINALEAHGIMTVGDLLACCQYSRAACEKRCVCREGLSHLGEDWQPKLYLRDVQNFGDEAIKAVLETMEVLDLFFHNPGTLIMQTKAKIE